MATSTKILTKIPTNKPIANIDFGRPRLSRDNDFTSTGSPTADLWIIIIGIVIIVVLYESVPRIGGPLLLVVALLMLFLASQRKLL